MQPNEIDPIDPTRFVNKLIQQKASELTELMTIKARQDNRSLSTTIWAYYLVPLCGSCPDDRWELEIKNSTGPCEIEGCDCHVVRTDFMKALTEMRRVWREANAEEVKRHEHPEQVERESFFG